MDITPKWLGSDGGYCQAKCSVTFCIEYNKTCVLWVLAAERRRLKDLLTIEVIESC